MRLFRVVAGPGLDDVEDQVRPGAGQVQQRPVRNGVLGLLLGIVLGLAIVFLRETLDTRIRNADDRSYEGMMRGR